MSLPLHLEAQEKLAARSSLFAGPRVQLDEHRWSNAFAAQLSSWADQTPTLVIMDGGKAILSAQESAPRFAERVRQAWDIARRFVTGRGYDRGEDAVTVFRFRVDASPLLRSTPSPAPRAWLRPPRQESRLVQLSPAALFRYFWRRRTIELQRPVADSDVEQDAIALLGHVLRRTALTEHIGEDEGSRRQLRHRLLARTTEAILASDIGNPHPLPDLARVLDVSPFHLARVFRAEFGVPIHQHLLELRLTAALVSLRAGEPNLSKLALELGFSQHSHFSAAFRKAIGWSPSEVRRLLADDGAADRRLIDWRCTSALAAAAEVARPAATDDPHPTHSLRANQ
jgi:AraC-like DNA-binding protein